MTARPIRFWSYSVRPSDSDGWAIGVSVVHCIDIDAPLSLRARGSCTGVIFAIAHRHHEAKSTLGKQLHRHRAKAFGDRLIAIARTATPECLLAESRRCPNTVSEN